MVHYLLTYFQINIEINLDALEICKIFKTIRAIEYSPSMILKKDFFSLKIMIELDA